MSADKAKLAHQLILVTITFLRQMNERKEKAHVCHPIGRAVSKAVRRWLTRRSWTYS